MTLSIGKLLIMTGMVLVVIGLLITFLPGGRLGRLPGDITIPLKNGKIYIPLTTCLLASLILTLLLWLFSHFRR